MNENIPVHVGIIMDGNGRWATERNLPRTMGHKNGVKTLKKLCSHVFKRGVKVLSVYAFSTENFKRETSEVQFLMDLFVDSFYNEFLFLKENNVKVIFSGRREPLPASVLKSMDKLVDETKDMTGPIFNICLNYGGQDEIVDMVKKISLLVKDDVLQIDDITKDLVNSNLYQELPPLDFVIRTSGEQRISNFMPYQSAYAEYYFPKVYFPDFSEKEFDIAIEEFQKRNRRFGGNSK